MGLETETHQGVDARNIQSGKSLDDLLMHAAEQRESENTAAAVAAEQAQLGEHYTTVKEQRSAQELQRRADLEKDLAKLEQDQQAISPWLELLGGPLKVLEESDTEAGQQVATLVDKPRYEQFQELSTQLQAKIETYQAKLPELNSIDKLRELFPGASEIQTYDRLKPVVEKALGQLKPHVDRFRKQKGYDDPSDPLPPADKDAARKLHTQFDKQHTTLTEQHAALSEQRLERRLEEVQQATLEGQAKLLVETLGKEFSARSNFRQALRLPTAELFPEHRLAKYPGLTEPVLQQTMANLMANEYQQQVRAADPEHYVEFFKSLEEKSYKFNRAMNDLAGAKEAATSHIQQQLLAIGPKNIQSWILYELGLDPQSGQTPARFVEGVANPLSQRLIETQQEERRFKEFASGPSYGQLNDARLPDYDAAAQQAEALASHLHETAQLVGSYLATLSQVTGGAEAGKYIEELKAQIRYPEAGTAVKGFLSSAAGEAPLTSINRDTLQRRSEAVRKLQNEALNAPPVLAAKVHAEWLAFQRDLVKDGEYLAKEQTRRVEHQKNLAAIESQLSVLVDLAASAPTNLAEARFAMQRDNMNEIRWPDLDTALRQSFRESEQAEQALKSAEAPYKAARAAVDEATKEKSLLGIPYKGKASPAQVTALQETESSYRAALAEQEQKEAAESKLNAYSKQLALVKQSIQQYAGRIPANGSVKTIREMASYLDTQLNELVNRPLTDEEQHAIAAWPAANREANKAIENYKNLASNFSASFRQ